MPTARQTSRALLLISFLAFVSIGFPDAVLGVAWPSMRETFDRALSNLGFILFASGTGYFLSAALSGRAIQGLGVGRLLALSTTAVAVGLFGYAIAPSFWILLVAAMLIGFGSGAVDAGLNFYAAEHFSVTVMNWLHAFFGLGAMIGPFIMAGVFAAGGVWRIGYVIIASAIAIMAVVFFLTMSRWNDGATAHDEDAPPPIPARRVLGMPTVWLQISMFAFMTGIEASAGAWTATIMFEQYDASRGTASIWAGVFWGAMALGRTIMVPLSRDLRPDRLVQLCSWGLLAGSALMTIGNLRLFQAGLIIFGLAMAPMFPTMMSLTPRRFGSNVALHAIGFQVSAATIGIVSIPTLAGIIAERTSLTAIPVVMVIVATIVIIIDRTIRSRVARAPRT